MNLKHALFPLFLASSGGLWAPACSSNGSSAASNGGSSSGGAPDSSGGSSSGGGVIGDAQSEAGGLGLLVDDMSAKKGTQISLQVPSGDMPGSYYAYEDPNSIAMGTSQLMDVPVMPQVTNADGSQIAGKLCFGGAVAEYAGLGMSLMYGMGSGAAADAGSMPQPFDASHYGGVSFYILLEASDGPSPTIHFGIPDTQTADPAAWPTSACAVSDAGACDDDFGSDLALTPGKWTKASFAWTDLMQGSWGAQFIALKTNQLIGMKWQANGLGADAGTETFNFCISDIYFTP